MRSFSLALVVAGCASTPRPPRAPPPPPPTERSSLEVLLAHADELGLSDEQYAKLRELEDARELKVREARPPNAPERPAGGMRGGMGGPPGGGMGGPPGGGMGGARGGGPDRERMEARLDELDAQAWFLAEPFLSPAQREQGAKLAMAWRERVLAWRAAMKARE